MEQSKIFKILLDGEIINTIPITNNTTIKTVKDYFKDYLLELGKDPIDYNAKIYLDNINKLDVDNTNKYDNINLNSVWNKITNGHIVLTHSPNYFIQLYTDAIYEIALRVDLKSLTSLCRVDKRMSQICFDDDFWWMRFRNDYGIMIKPEDDSWKGFYKGVKKYSSAEPATNEDLIKYGKYLTRLNLDANWEITDEGLKYVPNLSHLNLDENENITDEGLKYVPNLTILDLYENKNITDEGLKYVPNLTNLVLYNNENITDEGLKYVPNLTTLDLVENEKITDEGLKHLPNLTFLNLDQNRNITDEGLKYVSNLTILDLYENKNITDEGLKHLLNLL